MQSKEPKCPFCGEEECDCFEEFEEDIYEPQGIQEIYDASDEE